MSAVGFCTDDRFLLHRAAGAHPERPERLLSIREALKAPFAQKLSTFSARPATDEELLLAHSEEYLSQLKSAFTQSSGMLDADTFFNEASQEAARCAAGTSVDLVDKIARGELSSGFAAVRPPGHHATRDTAMGFCIFNNIAVAASSLLHKKLAKKILILDWDVHHGNGTQDIFWENPDVLFISLHQWPLYPGTGDFRESGGQRAKGTTINLPLPPGTGDADYLYAWEEVIEPAVKAFGPDFILISAGYDAYEQDPLGSMEISRAGFLTMAQRAMTLAQGKRIAALLEGGYNTSALGSIVSDLLQAWLGEPPTNLTLHTKTNASAKGVIQKTKELHQGYW